MSEKSKTTADLTITITGNSSMPKSDVALQILELMRTLGFVTAKVTINENEHAWDGFTSEESVEIIVD